MKYRPYIIYCIEQNRKHNYGLTMQQIRQSARLQYQRDEIIRSNYYGWELDRRWM